MSTKQRENLEYLENLIYFEITPQTNKSKENSKKIFGTPHKEENILAYVYGGDKALYTQIFIFS